MPQRELAVIGTALAGIEKAFQRFPQIIRASWLLSLAGAIALVILEAFWWGQLGMDSWAPDWLRLPVWAVVTTPANLAIMRILWLDPAPRREPPVWQPYAWSCGAVVIAVWSLAQLALDAHRFELLKLSAALLGIDLIDRSSGPVLARLGAGLEVVRLILKALAGVLALGLLCAIATDRAIGLSHLKRWLTMAPVRLVLLGILAEAALAGLRMGESLLFLNWWKTVDPPPLSMLPWRVHVLAVLRMELILLPAVVMSNLLSPAILIAGYRRLADRQDG